jgi:hypothetical protein
MKIFRLTACLFFLGYGVVAARGDDYCSAITNFGSGLDGDGSGLAYKVVGVLGCEPTRPITPVVPPEMIPKGAELYDPNNSSQSVSAPGGAVQQTGNPNDARDLFHPSGGSGGSRPAGVPAKTPEVATKGAPSPNMDCSSGNVCRLSPGPSRPPSPQPRTAQSISYQAPVTGFGVTPQYRVGGISLSKAAAERMAINIDIEGIAYRDGQIVIAGAQRTASKLDAALFLTSMRLACSPGDPFFSLDPADGKAWLDQSDAAFKIAWKEMEANLKPRANGSRFEVHTLSVQRDFPALWAEIGAKFPKLRTNLVFRPEWLRETRFGEILYKADVLLKELSAGTAVLAPGGPLRAEKIPGYIAAYQRSAARGLLERHKERDRYGHRLWFDLMPQTGAGRLPAYEDPDANIDRGSNRALYAVLKEQGYVDPPKPPPLQKSALYVEGGIADISAVYPKMFIRRFDHVKREDVPGASPDLDLLSADVNKRTGVYVEAYQELRDLTDIFRAYIASTKIVKEEPQVCAKLPGELTSGEKLAQSLPRERPSDLFVAVADAQGVRHSYGGWVSGGIALRGKQYYPQAVVEKETPLIAEIKRDLSSGVPAPDFTAASGRRYLAFDTREPPRRVPIVAAGDER